MFVRSAEAGNAQALENFISKQKLQSTGSVGKKEAQNTNESSENLRINTQSYSLMISTEAKLMVMAKKGDNGTLIVNSAEDKEHLLSALGKSADKTVNQDLENFCKENGIDTSMSRDELESYIVVQTEEMKQDIAKNSDTIQMKFDLNGLLDPFHKDAWIGKLPTDHITKMYEKKFYRYAKELTAYIKKYGNDQELYDTINDFLKERNKDGKNEVANLIQQVTDKIFAGDTEAAHKMIEDQALLSFANTFKDTIEKSKKVDNEKREKFANDLQKTNERITKQMEALRDKIKILREKLLEMKKNAASSDQIRMLEKELQELELRLSNLRIQGMPPEANPDDISIYDW